jgi:hypothetical protein
VGLLLLAALHALCRCVRLRYGLDVNEHIQVLAARITCACVTVRVSLCLCCMLWLLACCWMLAVVACGPGRVCQGRALHI